MDIISRHKGFSSFFIEHKGEYLHGNMTTHFNDSDYSFTPDLLFLHAEGPASSMGDYLVLRQILAQNHGLTSCAFDFLGHGSSGGYWQAFNLHHRVEQSVDVINGCFDCQPFSIVASGMGVDTAIRLAVSNPVDNLILLVPWSGMNSLGDTGFNSAAFTQIHALEFWEKTDAFSILEQFQGKLSIIDINDETSAQESPNVVRRLYDHAIKAGSRQLFQLTILPEKLQVVGRDSIVMSHLLDVILKADVRPTPVLSGLGNIS